MTKSAYNRRYYKKHRQKLIARERRRRKKLGKTECSHRARLRIHGVTREWYSEHSKNGCEICHRKKQARALHVDHSHDSKKVRGVLCARCNILLGLAKDDFELFQQAVVYLQRPGFNLVRKRYPQRRSHLFK